METGGAGDRHYQLSPSRYHLVNGADQFAADVFFLRLSAAHDAPGRREDGRAHAAEDLGDRIDAHVNAAAGLALADDLRDDALAVRPILEEDPQRVPRLGLDDLVVPDVALALQRTGDALLQLGGGH